MRRIEENGTYINLIPPGMYGDPAQDRHLREVSAEEAKKLTFFMYEEILAFKRAAEDVGLTRRDVEKAFFSNAHALIEDVRARLGKPEGKGGHTHESLQRKGTRPRRLPA